MVASVRVMGHEVTSANNQASGDCPRVQESRARLKRQSLPRLSRWPLVLSKDAGTGLEPLRAAKATPDHTCPAPQIAMMTAAFTGPFGLNRLSMPIIGPCRRGHLTSIGETLAVSVSKMACGTNRFLVGSNGVVRSRRDCRPTMLTICAIDSGWQASILESIACTSAVRALIERVRSTLIGSRAAPSV